MSICLKCHCLYFFKKNGKKIFILLISFADLLKDFFYLLSFNTISIVIAPESMAILFSKFE
jgi:hypothetical protein